MSTADRIAQTFSRLSAAEVQDAAIMLQDLLDMIQPQTDEEREAVKEQWLLTYERIALLTIPSVEILGK